MAWKIVFALLVSTTSIWAFDLKAMGRNYTFSCSYFTSVQGDMFLTFKDSSLPWGSEVTFITGWEGREGFPENRFEWADREETKASASAPFTWSLQLTKVLHERSHASFKDTLDFVIKISVPGQEDRYLNGNSAWGFFRVRLVESSPGSCVTGLNNLPDLVELPIETVRRD